MRTKNVKRPATGTVLVLLAIVILLTGPRAVWGQSIATPTHTRPAKGLQRDSMRDLTVRRASLMRRQPRLVIAEAPPIADHPLVHLIGHRTSVAANPNQRSPPPVDQFGEDRDVIERGVSRGSNAVDLTLPHPTIDFADQVVEQTTELSFAETKANDLHAAMFRRGDVTFRKMPLGEVVFVLSDQWNINIVASDTVEGQVSGTFRQAPLWEVLDSLLLSTGYGYQRVSESLVILPQDKIDPAASFTRGRFNGDASAPSTHGSSSQRTLPDLTDPSLGGDPTVNVAADREVAYFTLQYTEAETLSLPLAQAFDSTTVKIAVYKEENRLMVLGTDDQIATATAMIEQLDRPRSQVRITAMIYDVELGEVRNIGLNLSRDARGITELSNPGLADQEGTLGSFLSASSDLVGGGSSIGLRTIRDSHTTSALLDCLSADSESKLLADPSITVGDRHEASIRIVQRIPIITANPLDNSNAVFTQTQFEEAGVILNVLPRISRDGTIELTVKPEYSVVTEILSSGPVIDSRTAETTVRVNDGEMFVLGGLRQKTLVETVRGIPGLKDLKYVGRLFRGHTSEVRESELIVFLKPEIVTHCVCDRPRERMAYEVANDYLDRIPYAETIPLTTCCSDPNCPNHHPRPRINPGTPGLIDSEW